MKKEKLLPTLTEEEIKDYEERAEQIAKTKGLIKVHPVVLIDPGTFERKVCYLQEPNYITKVDIMDTASRIGPYKAGEELRELCVLKEESDAITYSDSPESDRYKMGVVDYCLTMISRLQNQFKKK